MGPAIVATVRSTLLQSDPIAPAFPSAASLDAWSLAVTALVSAAVIVVTGASLHAMAPRYAAARVGNLQNRPLNAFAYGLLALLVVGLLAVVLSATGVGAALTIPLLVAALVAWIVGLTIGYLAVVGRFVDADDWVRQVLAAGALGGVLALTGIGGVVNFVVGAAGFGAVAGAVPD